MNVGAQRVCGLKTLLGEQQRNRTLAQFTVSSFFIAEIIRCRLHGDKLSWLRTRFRLIAYIDNLLGSKQRVERDADNRLVQVLAQALALTTRHSLN